MNKYEIAARLAAHGADDPLIKHFIANADQGGKSPLENFVSITENKRKLREGYESDARPFEAVLAEIENAQKPPAEPSYDGPRYASGEQPMIGDEVRYAATEAGVYLVTDANEGDLAAGLVRIVRQSIASSHYATAATTQALTLVRRAEVAK